MDILLVTSLWPGTHTPYLINNWRMCGPVIRKVDGYVTSDQWITASDFLVIKSKVKVTTGGGGIGWWYNALQTFLAHITCIWFCSDIRNCYYSVLVVAFVVVHTITSSQAERAKISTYSHAFYPQSHLEQLMRSIKPIQKFLKNICFNVEYLGCTFFIAVQIAQVTQPIWVALAG